MAHEPRKKPLDFVVIRVIFLPSDFLKDDMVLKSMIETGSLFHTLMTLSVKMII